MFTINIFPHSRIRQARGKQSTEKQKQNGIVLKPTDLSILLTEFAAYCQHRSCIFRSYNYILIPAPRSLTPWATIVLIVNVALMFFFFRLSLMSIYSVFSDIGWFIASQAMLDLKYTPGYTIQSVEHWKSNYIFHFVRCKLHCVCIQIP